MPEMMKEPNLYREIGKVAWALTKILVVVAATIGLVVLMLRNHPVIAVWVVCGLSIVGQILYYGWQDYKSKKKDWDRQQEERRRNHLRPRD